MASPEPAIRLRSSACTSTGQVRENNEDNVHLWSRDDYVLAVVADGMGGAAAGEEASRLAVEAIAMQFADLIQAPEDQTLSAMGEAELSDELRRTIQSANDQIVYKAAAEPEYRGMGTTITLAFVRGDRAVFAHVGDSRAYLVKGGVGQIIQITSDHSFVEALVAAGHITHEQAEAHPMRNVLYRALGQSDEIDVDLYYHRLNVGDRIVLCSDGLTRHVRPEEIARLALESANPDVVSQRLIDLANDRGGEDNVSVIVITVEAAEPLPPTYRQAHLADDDEETLLLKGRTRLRNPLAPPAEATAEGDTLHVDQKMAAERLSDAAETVYFPEASPEALPDPLDPVIATRPAVLHPLPMRQPDSSPTARGQGEGHDTRLPDE